MIDPRRIVTSLAFALSVAFSAGCATVPEAIYVAPTDPFELSRPDYQQIYPSISTLIRQAADTQKWYENDPILEAKLRADLPKVEALMASYHIPTLDLVSRIPIANYTSFVATNGFNGKFKKQMARVLAQTKLSKEEYIRKLEQEAYGGWEQIKICARTGYEPSIALLRSFNIAVPKKDLYTQREIQATRNYQAAQERKNAAIRSNQQMVSGIIGGLAMGLAAAASTYGNQSYPSSTPTVSSFNSAGSDGNRYRVSKDSLGNTAVRGNSLFTGSEWKTTIEPDGDQRGFDANGNYWTYNESTGYYYNFGTGKTCVGKGVARSCF